MIRCSLSKFVVVSGLLSCSSLFCKAEIGIAVSGVGRVTARPDIATIMAGFEVTAPTLDNAMSQANNAMKAIIDILKSIEIADKDIQTSSFNVYPVTDTVGWLKTTKITAYRVSNDVTVKIRDLTKAGVILDALVNAGANRVSGITFALDDATPYQATARIAAVNNAIDKAKQLAKAAGASLGSVISISEDAGHSCQPVFRAMANAQFDTASVPVEAGELDIAVRVNMRFAIQ